ncbi:MAG: phosphatase PAP2 family protein [Dehalococcoidia bacterium]
MQPSKGTAVNSERQPSLLPLVLTTIALLLGALAVGHGPILAERWLMPAEAQPGPDALGRVAWFFNDFLRHEGIPLMWGASIALFLGRRQWPIAALFALAILVGPFNAVLKDLFDRPRPLEGLGVLGYPGDASYPSGHTMTAVAFFGLWWFAAPRLLGARATTGVRLVAALAIALTGVSRVWALAHWPTDVVAGVCFGAAFTTTVWSLEARVSWAVDQARAAIFAFEWHLATGIPLRHTWATVSAE